MIRRSHHDRPPAGSLHARAMKRRQTAPNLASNLLLNDGSLLLDLPGANGAVDDLAESPLVQTPVHDSRPATTGRDVTNPTSSPCPSDGDNSSGGPTATPFLIAPASVFSLPSMPDATSSPIPDLPAASVTQVSYFPQETALSNDTLPRFTTFIIKNNVLTVMPTPTKSAIVLSATTLASTPSIAANYTTSVASTPSSASSVSTSQTAIIHVPSATPSSVSSMRGGHTTVFWVGITFGAIFGMIFLLLLSLFLLKCIIRRRPNQLWGDEFFDPTLDVAASAVISGTNSEKPATSLCSEGPILPPAVASESNSFRTSDPPHEGNNGSMSEKEVWPPKTLLVSEFDGERSLQPPQPLRIANHVRGDYSSDGRSTLATPRQTFADGANDDHLGTPRPPQAAPFLRPSLRDGGLPVPWADSAAANHLAVPASLGRSQSVPRAADLSRHTSRTSRASSRWWGEDDLPADGWAATLRSNLYATLSALSLRDNHSDPGASGAVDSFTRTPSRRSGTSLRRADDGNALHRADTEGSKYSQASAALTNPFMDLNFTSSNLDREPSWPGDSLAGLGLRLKKKQSEPHTSSFRQTRTILLDPGFTTTIDGTYSGGGGGASDSGYKLNASANEAISSLDGVRASRVEEWLTRHKAMEEPVRTLWPNASGRDMLGGGAGGRGGGGGGGWRLESGRPLVRRRGSSHAGGYTSED